MGNKHSRKGANKPTSPTPSRNGSRKSCPPQALEMLEEQPGGEQRYSMDEQPIQLTPYQKTILREAWQRISKKGTSNIGSLIFRRMMNKNPDIKKLFQHVTGVEGVFSFGLTPIKVYRHHSVLFVKVLDSAIANLDDLRPFVLECIGYGEKHGPYRKYGFSADMWDVFGECMTESAREWEGWKKHRETLRAWTILVSFVVDRMRQGYESAVRKETFMQQLKGPSLEGPEQEEPVQDNKHNEANDQTSNANDTSTPNAAQIRRQSNAVIRKSPVMTRSKSALDVLDEQIRDTDAQL